jgi:hypothetical protein
MNGDRLRGQSVHIPGLALIAAVAIAGVALVIVTTDAGRDEAVFREDLYEQSLNDPLLRIEYADHPEYFMKDESTTHLTGTGPVDQPAGHLLGRLVDWLLGR